MKVSPATKATLRERIKTVMGSAKAARDAMGKAQANAKVKRLIAGKKPKGRKIPSRPFPKRP